MDLRRAILQQLVKGGDARFGRPYLVSTLNRETVCSEEAWEALWGLIAGGLVYLDVAGQGSGTDNWRWQLLADGERVADGDTWEPRDPDGSLDRIRREVPNLDGLVELYISEALHSFTSRCFLATSVMLGVAAERAFLGMARSCAAAAMLGAPSMAKELAKPRSNYFALWTEFRRRIEPARSELPSGLADALTLDGIADLRLTRNEVGHPTGRQIDEDTARVHLTIAPMYLRKMQLLAEYFAGQPLEVDA